MFAYAPPDQGMRYDHGTYDIHMHRSTTSSRSSSSSEKSIPRKRSFTGGSGPLPVSVQEESVYESSGMQGSLELTPASFEELDQAYGGVESHGSPIEGGSSSGGEHEDPFKGLGHQITTGTTTDIAQAVNMIGKSTGTNNFVTKLYQ